MDISCIFISCLPKYHFVIVFLGKTVFYFFNAFAMMYLWKILLIHIFYLTLPQINIFIKKFKFHGTEKK
jgi:hypothetical protein